MTHKLIGIFGGTFDPIHRGHTALAENLLEKLPLEAIHLIPCYQPAHRPAPIASAIERLAMLKLALEDKPGLVADDIEIKCQGISYSVNTLSALKEKNPKTTLCLIIGADNFLHFKQWEQWEKILKLSHLIVINRPGYPLPEPTSVTQKELLTQSHGKIYHCHLPLHHISASNIRQLLSAGKTPEAMLDDRVLRYINEKGLYRELKIES